MIMKISIKNFQIIKI